MLLTTPYAVWCWIAVSSADALPEKAAFALPVVPETQSALLQKKFSCLPISTTIQQFQPVSSGTKSMKGFHSVLRTLPNLKEAKMTSRKTRWQQFTQTISMYRSKQLVRQVLTLIALIQLAGFALAANENNALTQPSHISEPNTGELAKETLTDTMINLSAASYQAGGELAVESIVAGFGSDLATGIAVAGSLPLPTELAGVKIQVKDAEGVTRLAPLFFVSPAQINYQIPPGTAEGGVSMTVLRNNNMVALGSAKIIRVATGLFAANANGQGVPTAIALRVRADGSLNYEPVCQFNDQQARFTHVPIDLGATTDQMFLVLYGTGIRYNSGINTILATIGGSRCEVLYAGPAPGFVGVDQINLRLPQQLAGRGEVTVNVNASARLSNTLTVVMR